MNAIVGFSKMAPRYTSHKMMDFLKEYFDNCPISKGLWPPTSPDLSHTDFILWGPQKGQVYKMDPHTLEELKANIRTQIAQITCALLHAVSTNIIQRILAYTGVGGVHFEHLL
jgi:hypothetical protein